MVRENLVRDGSVLMGSAAEDTLRQINAMGPEQRPNVIQITVESLSSSFMTRYGNTDGITPELDRLAEKSLVFDQFYATGTRTVRGMEALTLSLPPTPGRSLVKRPDNENLFSLGSVFQSKGYDTAFLYGGYGYFDNMNYFFGNSGYRIVDRALVADEDITFANAWGACDEDLFDWSLREADATAATGKPFFQFVMTTSNHRPFTYPEGRIDLPSKVSLRNGGVKYTDYAIAKFLRDASTRPWYKDTIFVIVADHCASSAGKTTLPVSNYHIPLMIFAPGGQIKPGVVDTLTSQVDYAPTLLGLLNWSYPSRFFGRDVLHATGDRPARAFMGTYQKMGLWDGERLAVLSPVRHKAVFDTTSGTEVLISEGQDDSLIREATAYYQTASDLFSLDVYRAYAP
jgi:phosphoglycerol transferase MdoB-like AlkP superfamily enzyme